MLIQGGWVQNISTVNVRALAVYFGFYVIRESVENNHR